MNSPLSALVAQTVASTPPQAGKRAIYRHVTDAERVQILAMHADGLSPYQISAALDRPRITVRRVIAAAMQSEGRP